MTAGVDCVTMNPNRAKGEAPVEETIRDDLLEGLRLLVKKKDLAENVPMS